LHLLSQYLSLPASSIDDRAQLLIVNAGGHRMALIVDEIKGRYDIVMKNLGPHLRQVHGIAGATVLGNGQVVLILEMNNLFTARVRAANPSPVTSRQIAAQQPPGCRATVPGYGGNGTSECRSAEAGTRHDIDDATSWPGK
jgi:chemotaxis protein histidine kinase CheA